MTTFQEPICCMVIAQLPEAELDRIAEKQYRKTFPFAVDHHLWDAVTGSRSHNALISHLPGSEGSDWTLAEIISKRIGAEPVYSLWFDPERSNIVEWRMGKRVREHSDSPTSFARTLGFQLEPPDVEADWTPPRNRSVAVIEGTTVADVRRVLGERAEETGLNIDEVKSGTIVSATDGQLGTESWDLSDALPDHTVYHLQHDIDPDEFSVLILLGGDVAGSLRIPPFDSQLSVQEIKGAKTPEEILSALGVQPSLLGF